MILFTESGSIANFANIIEIYARCIVKGELNLWQIFAQTTESPNGHVHLTGNVSEEEAQFLMRALRSHIMNKVSTFDFKVCLEQYRSSKGSPE